jgi:hypothetical protein
MRGREFAVTVTGDASTAFPVIETELVRVTRLSAGLAMLSAGGCVSRITLSDAVAWFVAASVATTMIAFAPSVESATVAVKLPSAASGASTPFTVTVTGFASVAVPETVVVVALE